MATRATSPPSPPRRVASLKTRGFPRSSRSRGDAVHVEIWSDIACPWCYVGKRRFEAALSAYEHRDEVTVTWRSFELDPHAPAEREHDGASHLAEKYGTSRDEALAMQR